MVGLESLLEDVWHWNKIQRTAVPQVRRLLTSSSIEVLTLNTPNLLMSCIVNLYVSMNRENKALCEKKSRIYETCNTQVRTRIKPSIDFMCFKQTQIRGQISFDLSIPFCVPPREEERGRSASSIPEQPLVIIGLYSQSLHPRRKKQEAKQISLFSHRLVLEEARISVMYSVDSITAEISLSMAKEQRGGHMLEV